MPSPRLLLCFLLLSSLLTPWSSVYAADASPIRVAFLDPLQPGSPFWPTVIHAMRAAARDLGMTLEVYEARHWPAETASFVKALLTGPRKPDYLIITNIRGAAVPVLEIAEREKVPTLVIDAGLLAKDRQRFGGPREHFKYWIGQILPDNVKAGYDLANILADHALQKGLVDRRGRVQMIALGGSAVDYAGVTRPEGLLKAVDRRTDVELLQVVPTDWSYQQAFRKTQLMLRRYPEATVLWAGNGELMEGALGALQGSDLGSKRPLVLGCFDWVPQVVKAIRTGRITAAVGGHFLMGAWAMVLIYDYQRGIDFADERLSWQTEMRPLTRQNYHQYAWLLEGRLDKIDFRAFSKAYHPEMREYAFSLDALARQQMHARQASPRSTAPKAAP